MRLKKEHLRVALNIIFALKDIVDEFKDQEKVLRNALHYPTSPLYIALNTHTSRIPLTLFSPEGRFGFFSRNTNSLRTV